MPTARLNYWEAPQQSVGPFALDDAPVGNLKNGIKQEDVMGEVIRVYFGEIPLDVDVYVEVADPASGVSEQRHVNGVTVADVNQDDHQCCYRDYLNDLLGNLSNKNQQFAMWLDDEIVRAMRRNRDDAKVERQINQMPTEKYAAIHCYRGDCMDRRRIA